MYHHAANMINREEQLKKVTSTIILSSCVIDLSLSDVFVEKFPSFFSKVV